MTAHCSDSLSHPSPGHLSNIDFEAEVKPCNLKPGVTATHTTKINNQRTGAVHNIEICVRPMNNGVILNGNPSLTEYKHGIPILRSGKPWSHKVPIEQRTQNIPNDAIETAVTLIDSTQITNPGGGTPEAASLSFTVDIS